MKHPSPKQELARSRNWRLARLASAHGAYMEVLKNCGGTLHTMRQARELNVLVTQTLECWYDDAKAKLK